MTKDLEQNSHTEKLIEKHADLFNKMHQLHKEAQARVT